MGNKESPAVDPLPGTLDLLTLIVRTWIAPLNPGYAMAKHIRPASEDLLQAETGLLCPALRRLDAEGWIAASWGLSERAKRARCDRPTSIGHKQLTAEQSKWQAYSRAIGLLANPADQEAW